MMKKKILILVLVGIPLVVVGVVLWVLFSINGLVETAIETAGPNVTQTPVSVGDVNISLFSGTGTLRQLAVGNPEKYKAKNAFEVDTIHVSLNTKSALGDVVHVKQVMIQAPQLTFEGGLEGNNLSDIRKNIQAYTGSREKPEPGQEEEGAKVIIDDLRIDNAKLTATLSDIGQTFPVDLPSIHLVDIGKDTGGATGAEVANAVTAAILEEALKAVSSRADLLLKGGTKQLEKSVEKVLDKEGAGKVLDGVKGLLGK